MPCYQVNEISVEFQGKHVGTLQQAAKSLQATVRASQDRKIINVIFQDGTTVTIQEGKATGPAREVNSLRVAYANQIVKTASEHAKSKGYSVQQTGKYTTVTLGR